MSWWYYPSCCHGIWDFHSLTPSFYWLPFLLLINWTFKWSHYSGFTLDPDAQCCMPVCVLSRVWLCDPVDCSQLGSSVQGLLPGKNTGVGCRFLLQGIFSIQGSDPGLLCLLHWQADSLSLSHQGSPTFYHWKLLHSWLWFTIREG